MRAAVEPWPAGEQTVAVRNMHNVILGSARRHDGPGAAFIPQIDIVLGIKGNHPATGRAAGGLNAHRLAQWNGKQPVGISVP